MRFIAVSLPIALLVHFRYCKDQIGGILGTCFILVFVTVASVVDVVEKIYLRVKGGIYG